jgi:nucleoside-diphosphate-sugar epimerase
MGSDEAFNLSTAESATSLKLVEVIWKKIIPDKPLKVISDPGIEYGSAKRIPSVKIAKQVLGFEVATSLDSMLDHVIHWIKEAIKKELI